jgi:hypothetical protein
VVSPNESVKFAVGLPYPLDDIKQFEPITKNQVQEALCSAKSTDTLKKTLSTLGAV